MYSVDATRADIAASDVPILGRSRLAEGHILAGKGVPIDIQYDINMNARSQQPSIGPFDVYRPSVKADIGQRVVGLSASGRDEVLNVGGKLVRVSG
jgi:hypothetical protein